MPPRCLCLPFSLLAGAPAVRRCFARTIRTLLAVLVVGVACWVLSALSALPRHIEVLERHLQNTAMIIVPMFPRDRESIPLQAEPDRGPDPKLPLAQQLEWYLKRGKLKRA